MLGHFYINLVKIEDERPRLVENGTIHVFSKALHMQWGNINEIFVSQSSFISYTKYN